MQTRDQLVAVGVPLPKRQQKHRLQPVLGPTPDSQALARRGVARRDGARALRPLVGHGSLAFSLRKHTGAFLRRQGAKAACLRKASWVCSRVSYGRLPTHTLPAFCSHRFFPVRRPASLGEVRRTHLPRLSEKSRSHRKRGSTRHQNRPVGSVLAPIDGPNTRPERHWYPFSDSLSTLDFSHSRTKRVACAPRPSAPRGSIDTPTASPLF